MVKYPERDFFSWLTKITQVLDVTIMKALRICSKAAFKPMLWVQLLLTSAYSGGCGACLCAAVHYMGVLDVVSGHKILHCYTWTMLKPFQQPVLQTMHLSLKVLLGENLMSFLWLCL